jgi:hypothetical protein
MTRTALLIEDNEQNRYLATFLLEQHGYRVVAAPNGLAALSAPWPASCRTSSCSTFSCPAWTGTKSRAGCAAWIRCALPPSLQ